MPLPNLLHAAAGTCLFCHGKADVIARAHRHCKETFQAGWTRMVETAAEAARTHQFDEKALRLTLAEIARRSHGDGATVNQALEEGWKQGVAHAMSDGIISREEEERLRAFRDHLTLEDNATDADATWDLDQASGQRLMLEARLSATPVQDGDGHLRDLEDAMQEARLDFHQRRRILIRAWEATVEGAVEDSLLSLDEENALAEYASHFVSVSAAATIGTVHLANRTPKMNTQTADTDTGGIMPLEILPSREEPEDLDTLRLHDVGTYNLTTTSSGEYFRLTLFRNDGEHFTVGCSNRDRLISLAHAIIKELG